MSHRHFLPITGNDRQWNGLSESLADEQENYDKLYNKLKAAKSAYTTKSVEAEKKYKEAMLSYENADSQYSADVTGVDVSVDTAQDTLTDAKEALSEFEIFVGDGTIYSDYDGMIMSVGYEAGDDLSTSTSIVTFADTDAVTMTVPFPRRISLRSQSGTRS